MKKLIILLFLFVIYTNGYSQFFNKFSVAAGPVFGWNIPSMKDLNSELSKAGMTGFSEGGMFATGGGGFIDVPVVKGLRIGGYGYGFSDEVTTTGTDISKVAEFSYSAGFISVEYAKRMGKVFDWTLGGMVGIGSTNVKLMNYTNQLTEWNINNFSDTSNSGYSTLDLKTTSYTFVPQAGIGFQAAKFLYFKLNAGYLFTLNSKWKVEDLIEVNNFPSGIKADGFMVNLGMYLGLFID